MGSWETFLFSFILSTELLHPPLSQPLTFQWDPMRNQWAYLLCADTAITVHDVINPAKSIHCLLIVETGI